MEMTIAQVAQQYDRSVRLVQRSIAGGQLSPLRLVGRQIVIDDVAAVAWSRSSTRGRAWMTRTREAALDLLTTRTTTALVGSELSRLRSSLRTMTAARMAHASGGLGRWARYRKHGEVSGVPVGPSSASLQELGIVEGASWMSFLAVPDLDDFEMSHDVMLDADGDLGVLERGASDLRWARVLLDTYLLGDGRSSAAAASLLEERARDL
ncbi:hypothetical protein [Mariniluteicoccus flavus]